MRLALVLLTIVLCIPFIIADPECKSGCDAGLSTVCGNLNYPLYINGTTPAGVSKIEASILKFKYEVYIFRPVCAAFIQNFMCNVLFPACDASSGTPTPVAPCIDICYSLQAACGDIMLFFPAIMQPYINCNGVNKNTGLPTYSNDTSTCTAVVSKTILCNKTAPLVLPQSTYACQPFAGNVLPNGVGSVCAPYVTKKIMVVANWPLIQFVYASIMHNYKEILNAKKIFPFGCYQRVMAWTCQAWFPPCIEFPVPEFGTNFATQQMPCIEKCYEINDHCLDFWKAMNITYYTLNCDNDLKFSKKKNFTVSITPLGNYTGQCYDTVFPAANTSYGPYEFVDVICPNTTGRKTQSGDDIPLCDLKCPDASYSDSEWQTLVDITRAGSILSLVAMLFLIVSYLLQYERRKFPVSLHIWEFVATALFAVSFLIGGRNPQKTTWCYDEGTSATQSNNTTCAAQGFMFIFFGISLTIWCCNIAFTIFYGAVLNKKAKDLKRFQFIFHIIGWGIPIIFAIGAIASGSIGYGPPLAWCFIHFSGFGYGSGVSRDYPIFYIPMGTLFFVILILFVSTVGKIVQVQRASKFGTKGAKSHAGTLKAQIRLLIFIFIVGVISFSIFEWRLQIEGSKTSSAVGIQWAYCKVKLELGLSRDNICPGDINPSRIPYDHTAFESFLLSGIGILMFIAFGSDFGLYRHWLKIFKLAFSNEWGTLKKFVVNGVDPYPYSSNVVNVQTDTGTSTSKPLHSGGVSLSSNSSASATHSS